MRRAIEEQIYRRERSGSRESITSLRSACCPEPDSSASQLWKTRGAPPMTSCMLCIMCLRQIQMSLLYKIKHLQFLVFCFLAAVPVSL